MANDTQSLARRIAEKLVASFPPKPDAPGLHPYWQAAREGTLVNYEQIIAAELEERDRKVRELTDIVLRLQTQQRKWLTSGGINAMKPAFALAEELKK